ncbi:MAG: GNAT family N-acetyltransferase [Parasphingorhabdus sp.]|uniref:GNAT family N-acetyltransferase n=1 Tax=Parasphingorhabdus sp. TaxID=2709688 RepID=UPI00329A11C9
MNTPEPVITRAHAADVLALHKLVESAYRGESAKRGWTHEADLLGGQRTDREALQAIVGQTDSVILIAKIADQMIGCVQLNRVDNGLAYLGLLTVDPDRQAGGLGKILLREAEDFVSRHWQAQMIEMTVIRQRDDLIAYYQRRGYNLTGEKRPFPLDDPRFGLPKNEQLEFVVLRKTLTAA